MLSNINAIIKNKFYLKLFRTSYTCKMVKSISLYCYPDSDKNEIHS